MNKVNLAYILEDGMKIKIPSVNDINEELNIEEEEESMPDFYIEKESKSNIVNINKATQVELETLPGIGPSLALKIIEYRDEIGKFSSIDDLKNVSGIGDSKFENLKNYISVK